MPNGRVPVGIQTKAGRDARHHVQATQLAAAFVQENEKRDSP
jgi:hypothetical protein